jgi:hypothetical protein
LEDESKKKPQDAFPNLHGLATWGDRLVPLERFATEVAAHGRRLSADRRESEIDRFLRVPGDNAPVEGPFERVAVFGGVYSNAHALEALFDDAARRGAEALYCLGDLGGFGPHPERIHALLEQGGVRSIQGNYEESLAAGLGDCNCGYTDPRDNRFAALSYEYTAEHCSAAFKRWMGELPVRRRIGVGRRELLAIHGSPRQTNEFLFQSTSPVPFLELLLEQSRADGFLCTHTGLDWHRRLPSGREAINVGVIGRPPNDGSSAVRYAMIEARDDGLAVDLVALRYDHERLAAEMRAEKLPEEFVETIRSGWWTTCLEILPPRERAASRY